MESEIVDVVTDWESESYTGGYDGLRSLADGEFTGAVTEGSAWLFFLNGRIVGAFDGGVDAFEATDGTAFRAPDPSLPLLFTMLATGGETKAQYYTEDTSLSSADDTLSAGNFTGYVELSENVFSGDYYVVYYGGRKLPCAFVGQSRDLLTGDEAFTRAADETGIYEVMDVDVEITQLPEPEAPDDTEDTGADTEPTGTDTTVYAEDEAETAPTDTESTRTDAEPTRTGAESTRTDAESTRTDAESTRTDAESTRTDAESTRTDAESTRTDTESTRADTESTRADADDSSTADGATARSPGSPTGTDAPTDGGAAAAPSAPARESSGEAASEPDSEPPAGPSGPEPATEPTTATTDRATTEQEWQETRTIPSLDPSQSSTDGKPSGDAETEARDASAGADRDAANGTRGQSAESRGGTQSQSRGQTNTKAKGRGQTAQSRSRSQRRDDGRSAGGGRSSGEQTAALRERVAELESERDDARERLQETKSELEETEATVSQLRGDNERLESRVEELESELADARERLREFEAERPDGDTEVTSAAALSGTNLFVRYDSKSDPTLENAHDETATRTEVEENLRVETHTDFESDDAVVSGEAYGEFLAGTVEYNFVDWVIRELLYELQETGAEGKLRDLYDAIPKVDRAELHGVVELVGEDQKVEGERPFDVILRDRMGDPLVVANVTDAREATAEPEVAELIADAREVAESRDSLGAAVYVSTSFFEPRALEAVTAETGGGLLSRNKRASYVRLTRKRGFHLGLVESRDEGFHFTVPEL